MSHAGNASFDQFAAPTKRRRVDQDYAAFVAPSTSRTAAKAKAATAEAAARTAQLKRDDAVHTPLLDLATLPPASLQRYLSRYGLLEPSGSLSYHHAVHPVPPLPATLIPPLTGRLLNKTRSKPPHTLRSYRDDEEHPTRAVDVVAQEGSVVVATTGTKAAAPGSVAARTSKKRVWQEPKTPEFADLTAYDDPQLVVERLAMRAKAHWDKKDSVKEGETLTNFIFALRMRAHTLRATPPG